MSYKTIHDMKALVAFMITNNGSVINAIAPLWSYGIEYLGEGRFKCVNSKCKFFNKIVKITPKDKQ